MIDLSRRQLTKEMMDDPGITYREMKKCLQEIALLNLVTMAHRPTLRAIEILWQEKHAHARVPLRILDIGSGYGDFLRWIYRWARNKKIDASLTGIDINPWAEKTARLETPKVMNIHYITCNIFDYQQREKYHIIINSLITHHMADVEIVRMMEWMTRHTLYGWFINDLHRHWIPYYAALYLARLLKLRRLTRNDAPLSVARSFTRKDWKRLIRQSGLKTDKANIEWFFPFRYGVFYHV